MIGNREHRLFEISIAKTSGGTRTRRGVWRPAMQDPYMPKTFKDDFHPGGNSLCYMIQTAHLMGAKTIIPLAFTLESGTGYHFGQTNPVTNRASFYDTERPLHWLRWYESVYPGSVKLCPGWQGPIYDVFETATLPIREGHEPDASGGTGDTTDR